MAPCCQYDILDLVPCTKLLLEGHELLCQGQTLLFLYVLEGILEEDFSPVVLTLPNLKLSEMDEELFVKGTSAELSQRSLVVEAGVSMVPLMLLKVGRFDKACSDRVCIYESF